MAYRRPTWFIILSAVVVVGGFIYRRMDRKRFTKDLAEGAEFKPAFLEYDVEHAPNKAKKRLIWLAVATTALIGATVALGDNTMPVVLSLVCFLVVPVGFLLWCDYRQDAPVKRVEFGLDEVVFHFADGTEHQFCLGADTTMEISAVVSGNNYNLTSVFSDSERTCHTSLGFEGEVGFLAHCRDRGVILRWADSAPNWFKKKLLTSPGWKAADFERE
jgi:hypothetical protein